MSTENKKETSSGKVTPFPIQDNQPENPTDERMDRFLRESIIQEADEVEERLNHDPKLIGVGASDDLFQKIVEELKRRGEWEEEAETDSQPKPIEPIDREAIYRLLSKEDREALEAGHRQREKDAKRRKRRKKFAKPIRKIGVAAAAVVLVLGVGMSSEAGRKLVFRVWDTVSEGFGTRMKVNNADEKDVHQLSEEEKTAREEIMRRLNIIPVQFIYWPNEMEYSFYDIDDTAGVATISYSYQDVIIEVYMTGNSGDSVLYNQIDGKVVREETIISTQQEISIELKELIMNGERYVTGYFSYNDIFYYVGGIIPYEEMKKILEYLVVS